MGAGLEAIRLRDVHPGGRKRRRIAGGPALMFERYTEGARRSLFFARYECSQLGAIAIEAEHLLFGILRQNTGVISALLARLDCTADALRKEIESTSTFRDKIATSVEIPFSPATKAILQYAADEADRLRHNYIGTEHLVLGLLREENSTAAKLLVAHGLRLDDGTRTALRSTARAALEAAAWQTREVIDAAGVPFSELRVDGGMTANELLMQFQADILGLPVVRPQVAETTALGAAYAAGLAVGFWSDFDDLRRNWREDRRWLPAMDPAERDRRLRTWRKAVTRTFDWVDEDVR
jgi:hypothetical protein